MDKTGGHHGKTVALIDAESFRRTMSALDVPASYDLFRHWVEQTFFHGEAIHSWRVYVARTSHESPEHYRLVDWLNYNDYVVVERILMNKKKFYGMGNAQSVHDEDGVHSLSHVGEIEESVSLPKSFSQMTAMSIDIALDMAALSRRAIDRFLLFACDSRLSRAVSEVQRLGSAVWVFGSSRVHSGYVGDDLRRASDKFIELSECLDSMKKCALDIFPDTRSNDGIQVEDIL